MANRIPKMSTLSKHLLTNHFPLETHMSDMKPQIRLFSFKYIFGQQVLTKCQQNFDSQKLQCLGFQMPCRPMLYDVYIRFWNYLNFQLFSMNSYNAFDCCKIQKFLKNMIYLWRNVICYLRVVWDFLTRRLKAETLYFTMRKFWSTLSQHLLPKFYNKACAWYASFSNKWAQYDDAVVNTCWPACYGMILLINYGI